jgi:hypothetical protein
VPARVALATCAALPQLADDEVPLLEALRAHGVATEPAVWDDPEVAWDAYDLVVVRSTWDYVPRRGEFVAWAQAVPRLLNGADVIRWNTDKHYLAALPRAVQTQFLEPGEPGERWQPPDGEYVLKPTVSAGANNAARYGPGDEIRAGQHVTRLLSAGRTVMVQPYLKAVDEHGETALIFFGGEYSHAIRKGQMLRAGQVPSTSPYLEEDIRPREPEGDEHEAAEEILGSLPWDRGELLYARVDLVPGADGTPRLVELELTEPSLFLSYAKGAAERLAKCVIERL